MEKIVSRAIRACFVVAIGLLAIAVSEAFLNAFGYTITRGLYTAGRLLEIATVFLIFVVALLLHEIRDQLKGRSGRAME